MKAILKPRLRQRFVPVGRAQLACIALGLALLFTTGCVDSSRDDAIQSPTGPADPSPTPTPMDDGEFDTTAMLTNIVDTVVLPSYAALQSEAEGFAATNGALAEYCAAVDSTTESAALDAAQDAWRALMDRVQVTEAHALGPVTENGDALRNRIHSYANESLSTCGIDQSVILAEEAGFDLSVRSSNQRGIGTIEYLLFNTDLDHTCPPQVPTTSDWNARTDASRKLARCEYAQQVAADVSAAATTLNDRWQPSGGDFRSSYLQPSDAGTALQAMTDALFYIEINAKDQKLGVPTGINDTCSAIACPENIESPYSETTLANVRVNLQTFLDLFNGGSGMGFDDLIRDAEFPEVAERFQQNTAAAIAAIDANSTSLLDEVSSLDTDQDEAACLNAFGSPDTATELNSCALVGLLKRITDDLRIDFVTIVSVQIPGRAQSDND